MDILAPKWYRFGVVSNSYPKINFQSMLKKIDLLYFTYYNNLSNAKCIFEESPFLQNRQWNVAESIIH